MRAVLQGTWRPSPNFTERRGTDRPDMVVLHYTGMVDAEAALERLCDPAAEVSAHYLVAPDGQVVQMVAEEMRAWHAGRAAWGGISDVNSHSIGIELANPGHCLGYPPFPEPQMGALEQLLSGIVARWQIAPERVVGHACVAPGRKVDPGEKFDWRRLARQDLAVWEDFTAGRGPDDKGDAAAEPPDAMAFAHAARRLGLPVAGSAMREEWSEELRAVWRSVAMRFLPARASADIPDARDIRHVVRLAARWPVADAASG